MMEQAVRLAVSSHSHEKSSDSRQAVIPKRPRRLAGCLRTRTAAFAARHPYLFYLSLFTFVPTTILTVVALLTSVVALPLVWLYSAG